jgi:uncharacterized membrane protein YeaQ/YmgE (transglycosylase-associated protein family)
MTLGGFLILLLIAAICGAIGQAIGGYSRGGCLFTIGIGFLGAWAGLLIADLFDLPEFIPISIEGKNFPVIWSIIGAAILAALTSLIFSRKRR